MIALPGQVVVAADAAQVAREASSHLASALRSAIGSRGAAAIALSGGNTPRDAYEKLGHEPGIDWSKVDVLWVDERAVGPTDDRSNYYWAQKTLLAEVPQARAARMMAERPDLDAAAADYEALVRSRVPSGAAVAAFDVVVLGIGDDGHTASLFPGDGAIDVRDRQVVAVAARPGREARLTLTAPVLRAALAIFVLVVGRNKHAALARVAAAEGDVHETPSRLLRECRGQVTWIVDAAAVGG
jgi:6-phosphogluconolactonase